ncbi:MAG: hypothetical protein AAF366_18060 [Pseudomonadota bacterium]
MKPFHLLASAAALVLSVHPAAAQRTVAAYYAALGPQDYVNSRGQPLTSLGAVLQQDRANYHRFGRPDPFDEGDPYFGDPATRARIPDLVAAGDNGDFAHYTRPSTTQPLDADLVVFICETGGRLSHIVLSYANGDGETTCEGSFFAGQ